MSPYFERLAIIIRFVPRNYFAPLTGAVRGIREEYARLDREEQAALAEWDRKHRQTPSADAPPAS